MFRALRVADYRRYAMGAAVSNVGTWMHRVAQAWLVLEITGSPVMLGLITALQFGPMLVIGPWGGSLADRVNRRRLLLITQSFLMLQAMALAVVVLTGAATAVLVATFALLLGVTKALDAPARQTYVSDLVGPDLVHNAVALNSSSFNAARLIGPAIAGLIIAAWGTGVVFAVNSLTFLAFLLALAMISSRRPADGADPARSTGHKKSGVWEGVQFVRGRRDLLVVIAVAGSVAMFALNFQMNIAIMATQEFAADAQVYGVLASVMAVGSLTGSLLAARRVRSTVPMVLGAAAVLSVATAVSGLMPSPVTFGIVLVVCGAAALTMMTGANSYLQVNSDPEHRGRVMALYLAIFFGTTPIGAPIVGWLAANWGGRAALVLSGGAALVSVAVLAAWYRRSAIPVGLTGFAGFRRVGASRGARNVWRRTPAFGRRAARALSFRRGPRTESRHPSPGAETPGVRSEAPEAHRSLHPTPLQTLP